MLELELVIKELKEELNAAIIEKDESKEQAKNDKQQLEEVTFCIPSSFLSVMFLIKLYFEMQLMMKITKKSRDVSMSSWHHSQPKNITVDKTNI